MKTESGITRNIKLRDAERIVLEILSNMSCEKVEVAGSVRRKKDFVNDLDFVVMATDPQWRFLERIMTSVFKAKRILGGEQILRLITPFYEGNIQVDFYRATIKTYGITKLVRTGSADHNIYLAKLAIKNSMHLQYSVGLTYISGRVIAGSDECDVFHKLGLECIPPEKREVINGVPIWQVKQK